ncbi:MAG: malonyl-CoA decarboxylase family protein [Candidatus Dormibacteraeota bacterium]|nr:malonyl-CoA decarboxylase family protein [Candidatus Dormibacteraeota bacterium]
MPEAGSNEWRDQVGALAQRGREIVGLGPGRRRPTTEDLCRRLLRSRGEASALAIAVEVVERMRGMRDDELTAFADLLEDGFVPDPEAVEHAISGWEEAHDARTLQALAAVAESPRQELFRRLNMAPGGTAQLVRLRGLLGGVSRDHAVDEDLRHLLNSWFNRGFLQLREITWNTPAAILERLIAYEAVHEIRGWDDLRRRLAADRRCFGFFHPALPDVPLVFVEVALTRGLADAILPLIDPGREIGDPAQADTAIFYSISNTQDGLRGIAFGSFLIKQVMGELAQELPHVTRFATLSPLPGLAQALNEREDPGGFTTERLRALLTEPRRRGARQPDPESALRQVLDPDQGDPELLRLLAIAYLTQVRRRDRPADSVARFHLANGARLEAVHVGADPSPAGAASHGVMVNYRYEPDQVEVNHERYQETGQVIVARPLQSLVRRAHTAWTAEPAPPPELAARPS